MAIEPILVNASSEVQFMLLVHRGEDQAGQGEGEVLAEVLDTTRRRPQEILITGLRIFYYRSDRGWSSHWIATGPRRLKSGAWSDKASGCIHAHQVDQAPAWIAELVAAYRPAIPPDSSASDPGAPHAPEPNPPTGERS